MDEFIESCLNETKVNPYTKLESLIQQLNSII